MDSKKTDITVSLFLAVVAFITMIACIVWAVWCGGGKVAIVGGCCAFIMMPCAALMAHECKPGYGLLSYNMAVATIAYVMVTGDAFGIIPTLLMGGVSVLLIMSLIREEL